MNDSSLIGMSTGLPVSRDMMIDFNKKIEIYNHAPKKDNSFLKHKRKKRKGKFSDDRFKIDILSEREQDLLDGLCFESSKIGNNDQEDLLDSHCFESSKWTIMIGS